MFDYASFFGGSNAGSFGLNSLSSINFSEYRMIKSGSYKRLMKAYYAEQSGSSAKSSSTSSAKTKKTETKSVAEKIISEKMKGTVVKDPTGLTQMQTQANALKTAAEAFDAPEVFQGADGGYDAEKAVKAVNNFVNKYNATLDQAGKVNSKDVAQEVDYMKSMSNTMKQELEKIGITIGDDGKLSVKEETLKNAHEKDVEALFAGQGSYAGEIAKKAAGIGSAAFRNSCLYSSSGTYIGPAASSYSKSV